MSGADIAQVDSELAEELAIVFAIHHEVKFQGELYCRKRSDGVVVFYQAMHCRPCSRRDQLVPADGILRAQALISCV